MVTHKPDNAEAAVVPAQVEGRHTHLSAENAGVSMTSVDTNAAHRAMRTAASGGEGLGDLVITGAATRDRSTVGNDSATPKDRAAAVNDTAKQQDWQPSLKSDIFNDLLSKAKISTTIGLGAKLVATIWSRTRAKTIPKKTLLDMHLHLPSTV